MVLPQVTYNAFTPIVRRRVNPNIPTLYEYEYPRTHRGRANRRARTVRVESLPRSMRPPEERAARANALRNATQNARRSVRRTLYNMNTALLNPTFPNFTKPVGKVKLTRNNKNAITNNNLGRIVVQVWNGNSNRQYMSPNTFQQFLGINGVYTSPYTRNPGQYRILKATFTNAKIQNNRKNVLAKAMAISKTINKQRNRMRKKLIPRRLVGRPNTSGNAAFAASLNN